MIDLDRWPIVARRSAVFTHLAEGNEDRARKDFAAAIQQFANVPVSTDDVHIRGMRIVNSQRDFFFSRFALDALTEVAELLPGRPVMQAHNYGTLPMGTHFAAQRVFDPKPKTPRRDSYWVESLFYFPKDEAGNAMAKRIDYGNWREVSLGWMSLTDTCSICDNSIRSYACSHVPGEVYKGGICEYEMAGITSVLEGSMVFAGGQKDTTMFSPERALVHRDGTYLTPSALTELKRERASGANASDVEIMLRDTAQQNVIGLRAAIQSIECTRDRFDGMRDAAKWVRDNSFRADKPDERGEGFYFQQFNASSTETEKIPLDVGVNGIIVAADGRGLESLFGA